MNAQQVEITPRISTKNRHMKKNPRQDDIPGMEQLQSELLFISTFLREEKRERWKDFLPNPKNRIKAVRTLDHFKDLDERCLVAIPKDEQLPEKLAAKLRSLGAPKMSFLISSSSKLDGKALPLLEALLRTFEERCGTLLICLPERLGYFHDEDGQDQWILKR